MQVMSCCNIPYLQYESLQVITFKMKAGWIAHVQYQSRVSDTLQADELPAEWWNHSSDTDCVFMLLRV